MNINDILSEKEDELTIMSLYSSEEFIFVGFPLSFAILKHHELLKYFSLPSSAFTISFSDTHSLVAHSFESITTKYNLLATVGHDYLSDFEEESISEVNELQSVQSTDENTAIAAEIISDVDQEITVTMNFEPKSKILNFSDKAKSNKPKKTKIQDKPVTFHKKIKSSGYGVKLKILKKPKNLLNQKFIYPKNTQAPSVLQEEHLFPRDAPLHNGPIFNVQYSRDAGRLATCGNDAAFIVKMPISKSKGERIPLVGHEGPINSITWSSECKYLLTSSSDSTAKM